MIHGTGGGFRGGGGAGALGDLKVPPWGLVRRSPYGSAVPRELMARPVVTYGGNPGQRAHGAWPGSPGRLTHPTLSPTPVHGPPAQPSAQPLLPDAGLPPFLGEDDLQPPTHLDPWKARVSPSSSVWNPAGPHLTVPRPPEQAQARSSRCPPPATSLPQSRAPACTSSNSQGPSHLRAFALTVPSAWKVLPQTIPVVLSFTCGPSQLLSPLRTQSPLTIPSLSPRAVHQALPESHRQLLHITLIAVWVRTSPVSPSVSPAHRTTSGTPEVHSVMDGGWSDAPQRPPIPP